MLNAHCTCVQKKREKKYIDDMVNIRKVNIWISFWLFQQVKRNKQKKMQFHAL